MTTPLSGMFCHPWTSTCYYQPDYQIWSLFLPTRRYEKKFKMWKIRCFGVVRRHLKTKVTKNSAIRERIEFLSFFHSNYVNILHRFWDIARYWSKIADLNLPHIYLAPPLGMIPLEFRQDFWRQKTRFPALSYRLCNPRFSHLVADGQTDRQTNGHTMTAYTALAWRRAVINSKLYGTFKTIK